MSTESEPREVEMAARISCAACDFCPAVHVNLMDENGEVYASANVPAENAEPFVAQFRRAMAEIARRHPAPGRRQ